MIDDNTRRAAMRVARPFDAAATAIAVASIVPPLFGARGWLVMLPMNLVALAVVHVGRWRARRLHGIDPGAGRSRTVVGTIAALGVATGVIVLCVVETISWLDRPGQSLFAIFVAPFVLMFWVGGATLIIAVVAIVVAIIRRIRD
jgi:hypothetical protein